MDWYDTVFEVIDMRSFSNLWYWIGLAVMWSTASHWILGVPFDMIQKAQRNGGQAEVDLHTMVRIMCERLLYIGRVSGLWLLTLMSAILSALFVSGFWYQVEFAQAVFLLAFPMAIVWLVSLSTARLIMDENSTGALLFKRLNRHRRYTQIIGMISVFVTSMWGMFQNLSLGVFG